ncbi:MAG: MerR family transcriptional regulator [Thermomicrobiales bacterium]
MYDREPLYVISVAARILGMHAQTLRKYEREQFIVPSRTQGRLRLYSAEDIERLRQIKSLVERGLNLAGVELALTLTQQLDELRRTVAASNSHGDAVARCDDAVQAMLALLGAPERQADSQAQSTTSGRRR